MSMNFQRMRTGQSKGFGGPPLRTVGEMAEEFGVKKAVLAGLMGRYDGPKSAIKQRSLTVSTTWYDPKAMRTWWNALPEDVRKGAKP